MKRSFIFLFWALLSCLTAGAAGEVRNVIYLIGDGMGLAHVAMMQIENGYAPTAFERAQHVALVTTRSTNNRVTDSAASGTALATGVRTNNGTVGMDPEGNRLESMIAKAGRQGMATGIVVTCSLLHATPAAFYAHAVKRYDYATIRGDLLASGVDVLYGGGGKQLGEEYPEGGTWSDAFRSRGYTVARTLDEAAAAGSGRLLAVLAEDHLPLAPERGNYLPEAVGQALDRLSKGGQGFLLMVEGSQIDMAAHANDAACLLAEMRDFERAVAAAMDFADRTPGTLVVVAADHETGGLVIPANDSDFTQAENGLNYRFGNNSHTASPVVAYSYGPGAERLTGILSNAELGQRIMELLGLE